MRRGASATGVDDAPGSVHDTEPTRAREVDMGIEARGAARSTQARSGVAAIKLAEVITRPKWQVALLRLTFLSVTALGAAATGFISLGVSHRLVDRSIFSCTGKGLVCKEGPPPYLLLALAVGLIVGILHLRSRPDRSRRNLGYIEEWVEALKEMSIAVVALVFLAFFWRPSTTLAHFAFSRGTIIVSFLVGTMLLSIYRTVVRAVLMSLRRNGRNLAPVIVVGNSAASRAFIRRIEAEPATGYRIVAHLNDFQEGDSLGKSLQEIMEVVRFEEVIFASQELLPRNVSGLAAVPELRDVQFRAIPELYGLAPGKVQMQTVADFPLLALFYNPVTGARWVLKRTIDVTCSLFILLVAAPVIAVSAVAIRLTSSGPILFRQERVGMDGRRFEVLKFRTMYHGAPDARHREFMQGMLSGDQSSRPDHGFYKLADDPRMTGVGKFLRRLSIDELPQLFNVLKGEMSVVGPRPALAYEVELYEDWQMRRLDVLPGITGLWQVSGRSKLSPTDMLRLDVMYAETWTLGSDLKIILKTLPAILRDEAR